MKILNVNYYDANGDIRIDAKRFLRRKESFIGQGTVWHDLETGRRLGTLTESRLSEVAWKFLEQVHAPS